MSTSKANKKAARGISHAKLLSTSALTAAGLVALMPTAALAVDDYADWDNVNIVAGDADVTDTGLGTTNIDQHSMQAVGEAQELHIGSMGHVNIDQNSSGALFVARVIGNHSDPTQILGKLTADGKVMVLDRNGVLFGANSVVDVAGIAVSTGEVANDDIMDGNSSTTFNNFGDGKIVLEGTINVADAGLAAFVSPTVINSGVINAKLGTVAMAAGEEVTLDLYGDGLVEITLDGELSDALLENKGAINAQGGNVIMTAAAAKDAVDNIINVSGVVDVSSATQKGGKIVLSGGNKGKVEVSGKLKANGEGGGEVIVTGQNVTLTETSEINTDGGNTGDGGVIGVWADSLGIINGRLSALGGRFAGNGGFIETSGLELAVGDEAEIDASAAFGNGGHWLIDPLSIVIGAGSGSIINVAGSEYARISNTTVSNALSNGTSVTIETGINSAFSLFDGKFLTPDHNDGDILVRDNITHNGVAGKNSTLALIADGDISIENNADIRATGASALSVILNAEGNGLFNSGNITLNGGSIIETNGGSVVFNADDSITVDDDITTKGGSASFRAGGNFIVDDANDAINTANGDVTVRSSGFGLTGTINAGSGKVTLARSTSGSIDVGDWNGSGFLISQNELDNITADTITVGLQSFNDDNDVKIDNADFTRFNTTNINTRTPDNGSDENALFGGSNKFNTLNVFADDNVIFANNATVHTFGDVTFTTDTNSGGVGGFLMGDGSLLDSNGKNITINTLGVILGSGAGIDAINAAGTIGGNIDINNKDIFAAASLDSVRTTGTGTISLNQYSGKGYGTQGYLQNAISALSNTGTGQNTLDAYAGNLGSTYNENLTIDQANLKLNGVTGENIVIAGNGIDEVIKATASNFNLDPVTIDGNGADYGITASGLGANGLIIDGNTFRDTKVAGVLISNTLGGTSLVKNNIFEGNGSAGGTATRGVQIGTLNGGSTVNIEGNTFAGGLLGTLRNAVWGHGAITGGNVNITGANTATTSDEAILFDNTMSGGAVINISGLTATAGLDAVRFGGSVTNSTIGITGSSLTGGEDGIEFTENVTGSDVNITKNTQILGNGSSGFGDAIDFRKLVINSDVNIKGNTLIRGNDDGIQVIGGIQGGTFTVDGDNVQTITGLNGDGINLLSLVSGGGNGVAVSNNAVVKIEQNTITGTGPDGDSDNPGGTGDGVLISGDVTTGASVIVQTNTIKGYDDGVNFHGNINGASAQVLSNTSIKAGDMGVNFNGNLTNATVIVNNNHAIVAGNNGVNFAGNVSGGFVQVSGNNDGIEADDHGIYFGGTVNGGATLNIHDNIIKANLDNGVIGSGIFFDGAITSATINIGDGERDSDPSNFITVADNGFGSDDNLDGIHFNKDVGTGAKIKIDGNRIGYTGTPGNQGSAVADNVTDDGIEFRGQVTGTADIDIIDNRIMAEDDGVRFGAVNGTANVLIGGSNNGNNITGLADGIQFGANVTGNALVEISQNNIAGNDSGIEFEGVSNTKSGSEQELYIYNNYVSGGNNGIRFNGDISSSSHDTRIDENTILGLNEQGILFAGDIDSAHVRIVYNDSIEGEIDGVRVLGTVEDDARVDINDNDTIEGGEEAIHFFDEIDESTVNIVGNDNLRGGDNGVEFAGDIDDSTIVINQNNHGIHANNHGILFGGDVFGGSDLDIHDNIISANEDGGTEGDGIHFAGDIYTATINIGDGNGPGYYDNPSNIIKGWDGIHFDGDVNNGARIVIDGNRLGYYKDSKGNHSNAELSDDGIQFIGDVDGDAKITITENRIQADDDGISFIGEIQDTAEVTIGGSTGLGNVIFADGDGIQFEDDIEDNALIKITHNEVEAEEDGVVFNGDTSNFRNGHDEEILIAYNDIVGGENGVNFEGEASGSRHDIVIRNNDRIEGEDEDGIVHSGDIRDAELWILDNEEIHGDRDGIHIEGFFYDDARIVIDGNDDISADDGDGIEVTDNGFTSGADVDITENYVHDTGDNGIEVNNVDGVEIKRNDITGAGNDGINVWNSDRAEINWNDIYARGGNTFLGSGTTGAERDGIHVAGSDYVDIIGNDITGDLGYDFLWFGGAVHREGAGRDGIHVSGGRNADIFGNDITGEYFPLFNVAEGAGRDGIHVYNNYDVDVGYNDVFIVGDDGIDARNSDRADIFENDIYFTGGDGIQVRDSNIVEIDDNYIRFAGDDGIDLEDSFFSAITDNDIRFTDENGIELNDSAFILIDGNEVEDADEAGIFIDPSAVVFVTNNKLTSNDIGLYVQGPNNGYIDVTGNTFLNNDVGARFESGIIDLTHVSSDPTFGGFGNKFIGGQHGMVFDAWNNDADQLSLVRDGGIFAGGYTYDGQPNDTWPSVLTNPSNFGGTIGQQYFEGQSISFVTLRRNTFTSPRGEAIWLNAQDSTYYNPAELAAFKPSVDGVDAARLAFLEDMFRHRPDATNRGIFWFGAIPEDAFSITNFERHFNQFGPFGGGPVGLNITLTGLPSISGASRAGGTAAFDLNAIAPAAGGEEGAAQPANASDLSDIEPAAGGNASDASCWNDAVSAAGAGSPVNFDFGGTFEESIADAAGCGAAASSESF